MKLHTNQSCYRTNSQIFPGKFSALKSAGNKWNLVARSTLCNRNFPQKVETAALTIAGKIQTFAWRQILGLSPILCSLPDLSRFSRKSGHPATNAPLATTVRVVSRGSMLHPPTSVEGWFPRQSCQTIASTDTDKNRQYSNTHNIGTKTTGQKTITLLQPYLKTHDQHTR